MPMPASSDGRRCSLLWTRDAEVNAAYTGNDILCPSIVNDRTSASADAAIDDITVAEGAIPLPYAFPSHSTAIDAEGVQMMLPYRGQSASNDIKSRCFIFASSIYTRWMALTDSQESRISMASFRIITETSFFRGLIMLLARI